MKLRVTATILAASITALLGAQGNTAGEWPQWRGPDRSGISKETGLAKSWPAPGPPLVWTASGLGSGYGSLAIKDGHIFVQSMRNRTSMVHNLNVADGKYVWSKTLGTATSNDRGPGPRGTPTTDGDRLYVLTESGDLVCLKMADATVIWQRNILRDFSGRNIQWLLSESPLVDGDFVVVTPGGRNAGMVKLDKMTGKTVWAAAELSDEAGYSSIVLADVPFDSAQGRQVIRAYTTITGSAAVGVRATDGKVLWRYDAPANDTANITTPLVSANQVFYTSAYGTGGGLLNLRANNGGVTINEVYFTREMQNHHGGVVLVDGVLYGFNNAILAALDFASGRPLWRDRSVGKGALTYADGRMYILSEDNVMGLADVSRQGYKETGRFQIPDQGLPSWAHPVVAGGRLYIRSQNMLWAYDVRNK